MSSVFFDSAARIIKQVFDWLQTSDQGKTSLLIADTFQSGIDNATGGGEGFTLVPGTSPLSVTVQGQGIAYDPLSNRIFISSSDTTVYNPANTTATTNDGLGNFILTPKSSGVVNIPLTASVLNYLWVDYLATTDASAFTLNEITNAKIFYKITDGYNIQVTTVNTPPDSSSVFLGTVNAPASGIIASGTISQLGRQYFNILPNIVPITTAQAGTNPVDRTPAYAPASTYTLEAHIKAVGTGTGQSPTNPHNMSLADLGVSTLDTVVAHRQLEHGTIQSSGNAAANAIIAGVPGTPAPSTSGMATSINIVDPGSDYLTIYYLLATEFAIVNGDAYNTTDIFGGPSNANVFFTSLPSGTYNVYWDSVVEAFSATTSDISGDVTKLWLCTVTWTLAFSPGYNHLSGLIDIRRIGSSTHILQRWITGGRPGSGSTAPASGEFGFNITTNLMEYWDGTQWQQPVNSSSNTTVPTGTVLSFAGTSAPSGFLMANGTAVSRTTYANLFSVISTVFGPGDGSTTFNVPNMTDNVPIGAGTIAAFGATAGSSTHTLTSSEVPTTSVTVGITDPGHNHSQNAHTHTITDPGHAHAVRAYNVAGGSTALTATQAANLGDGFNDYEVASTQGGAVSNTTGITGANSTTATNNSNTTGITASGTVSGGNGAHSIVQPSLGLNYIIKT